MREGYNMNAVHREIMMLAQNLKNIEQKKGGGMKIEEQYKGARETRG